MSASRFESQQLRSESPAFSVFDAVDKETGNPVRLLRLTAAGNERESMKQLFRALQKLEREDLEQVVAVVDEEGEDLLVALKPEQGTDLVSVLHEGPLTVEEFESVATGLLNALAAIHDLGLVHGAVRPEQLWIDRSNPKEWAVRLHGFGLGFGDGGDGTKATVKAYRCAAPEQWQGAGAHRASDVWAAGCVLYEALSGRPAFDAKTLKELRTRHLARDTVDLAKIAPQVPKWVTACVMRLLTLDPAERPRKGSVALEIFTKGEREEADPTRNAPKAGTATGATPRGGTSSAVPVPAAAQVMAPWTQSVKPQAPKPAAQPLTATRMVAPAVTRPNTSAAGTLGTRAPLPPAARHPTGAAGVRQREGSESGPPWKWIGMAGGALLLMLIVWLVMGRNETPADSAPKTAQRPASAPAKPSPGPTAGGAPVPKPVPVPEKPKLEPLIVPVKALDGAPDLLQVSASRIDTPPVVWPKDRPAPPAATELYSHTVASLGVYGYGMGQGVLLPLEGDGAVADWGDLAPMGGSNTFATFPWNLEQRRIVRQTLQPRPDFPLRRPTPFIVFQNQGKFGATLILNRKGMNSNRPFSGGDDGKGLTFALVAYADSVPGDQLLACLPGKNARALLLANVGKDGQGRVWIDAEDPRPKKPANRRKKILKPSEPIKVTEPMVLLFTWAAAPGTSQLTVITARGQVLPSEAMVIPWPDSILGDVSLGAMPAYVWKQKGKQRDTFRGGIAEVLLYRRVLSDADQRTLRTQLQNAYLPPSTP
ncbi:MAG: protein kinase [Verrucomicrobiales bacterium]|nr:protein kinase [Verrucomicrobiales bacterium]